MTLNPVLKEHEGTYLCKADNDVGEPLEKEANLIVHGKICILYNKLLSKKCFN